MRTCKARHMNTNLEKQHADEDMLNYCHAHIVQGTWIQICQSKWPPVINLIKCCHWVVKAGVIKFLKAGVIKSFVTIFSLSESDNNTQLQVIWRTQRALVWRWERLMLLQELEIVELCKLLKELPLLSRGMPRNTLAQSFIRLSPAGASLRPGMTLLAEISINTNITDAHVTA